MFRDQSNDTASKFHVVEKTAPDPSVVHPFSRAIDFGDCPANALSSSSEVAIRQPTGTLPPLLSSSLSVSPEDQAACYFFSNYVLDATRSSKGYMEYIPGLYNKNSPDSPLAHIITSLGMAGLANVRNAPEAKAVSTYKYTSALHGVNAMLRDPARATDDETLVVTNTGIKAQSINAWLEHINGAMALISLRGKDQLKTKTGLRLFYQLRSQILIGSLHRRTPVPENLVAWSKLAEAYHDEPIPENKLADILFRFNNWRADALSSFTDYRDPLKNVETALNFDAELMEWLITFQLQYAYTTMPIEARTDDVFADYYHIYPDIFTAIIWQHFRCTRILINEIIVTQIAALYYQTSSPSSSSAPLPPNLNTSTSKSVSLPPSFPFASNFYASHALLTTLTHDICASVPYYLNFHIYDSDWANPDHPPAAANGNLLLWPLYMVGQLHATSPMMRAWAIERMKTVSKVTGVMQLSMVGNLLTKGQELTVLG